jgi:hypothetical protein
LVLSTAVLLSTKKTTLTKQGTEYLYRNTPSS